MTFLKDCLRGHVSLTCLSILCHGPGVTMTTAYIWSILKEFTQLEEFWFEFTADGGGMEGRRKRGLPGGLGRCERLRKVGIMGARIEEEDVVRLGEICPCLEEMEINGEVRFYTI
jgi:hypothetical protein